MLIDTTILRLTVQMESLLTIIKLLTITYNNEFTITFENISTLHIIFYNHTYPAKRKIIKYVKITYTDLCLYKIHQLKLLFYLRMHQQIFKLIEIIRKNMSVNMRSRNCWWSSLKLCLIWLYAQHNWIQSACNGKRC